MYKTAKSSLLTCNYNAAKFLFEESPFSLRLLRERMTLSCTKNIAITQHETVSTSCNLNFIKDCFVTTILAHINNVNRKNIILLVIFIMMAR